MTKVLHTKICIVGAGPSGAATSIFLGRKKINHILIDAAKFPRDKICGDGLDVTSIRALNIIDKNLLPNEINNTGRIKAINGFKTINSKGKTTVFDYVNEKTMLPLFATTKRIDFDSLLHEKIDYNYCNFLQETKAISFDKVNGFWEIEAICKGEKVTIKANCLVGADGDHSLVLKAVGNREVDRNNYAGGIRQYWKNVENLNDSRLYEIYFPKKYPLCYLWIFPLKNNECNVGIVMQSKLLADKKVNLKEVFKDIITNDIVFKERFKNATPLENMKGWGLPLASVKRKSIGDGWMLIGDAASIINPLSGEGIGTGMISGIIAAEFLEKAVKENDFTEKVFNNFEAEVYKRINNDIKIYKLMVKYPKMFYWVFKNLVPVKLLSKIFPKVAVGWYKTEYEKDLNINVN